MLNADTIKEYFSQQFGTAPTHVIRAPGRINLIGEHTDYNGGLVLPAAIDKAIWLAAGPRTDDRFVFFAADLGDTYASDNLSPVFQNKKSWANYLLGVIREAQLDGHKIGGLNILFGGDVPLGAGLSSSAAIGSGMAMLLQTFFQLSLDKMDLVHLAQRSENHFVGMQCGIMDMFASIMGRENHVMKLDCRNLDFEYFPFDTQTYSLLLLDSGVKHQLIDSQYNTRRAECESGVNLLKQHDPKIKQLRDVSPDFLIRYKTELPKNIYQRCQYVVEEIARVKAACEALQKSNFIHLGQLMFACHDGLNLEYEVCVQETNFLIEMARGQILGARQMGGGFGGCTLNLLKTNEIDDFIQDTSEAYHRVFGLALKAYPVRLTNGCEIISKN
jgi:galactokinase